MTTAVTGDRGGYNFLERAQQRSPGSILGQMLTVKQAAQYLGITPNALQRQIKNGIGPTHYKLGNRMLFKKSDVVDFKLAAF
jgi:excisionase family DNA binding protein